MKFSRVNPTAPRRRPVRDVLLACMLVLLLAQGLTGMLSLSALNRLASDTTADRIQLLAVQNASQIQGGLNLGKPLAQYFGLGPLLQTLQQQIPDLSGASVVLADGQVQAAVGQPLDAGVALQALYADSQGLALPDGMASAAAGVVRRHVDDGLQLAVPLTGSGDQPIGALVLQVAEVGLAQPGLLFNNALMLGASTLGAALLLIVLFRYVIPLHVLASGGRARTLAPVLVLLLAQGLYAAYTIHTFRSVWLDVTRDNSQILGQGLQKDLNRVLGYGIAPTKLRGVEQPMARLAAAFPVMQELRLTDPQGHVLARADAHGALSTQQNLPAFSPDGVLSFPLQADGQGPVLAELWVLLDPAQIRAGVRARILDAGTVAAVAVVVATELLLLLGLLMNRAFAAHGPGASGRIVGPDDSSEVGLLVRPVMFGFLFAWALPLGFLPLYARSFMATNVSMDDGQMLMALPIAVEMGCGLLTALLAGRLTDRRGWQVPVLGGIMVSVVGNLACALVDTLPGLVAARGLIGLGYGLAWMGLQGFIVVRSPPGVRGRNMASVIAGLFAGHLSGAAVGAMLMQQLGFQAVFYVAAIMLCLPLLGVLKLMWPYRGAVQRTVAAVLPVSAWRGGSATKRLLLSRDFGILLLASIVPFAIAQVGLLTYALPLYLEAHGAQASSIGRVLMLYGLCVIYLGPYMGRLADHSTRKKYWIVAGGVVGSLGLISLDFVDGLWAAALAVVLLALASCLAGAAQTPYMLALGNVQRYGAAGATSLMRAADKFGQMLGPLMVAGLFASVGMSRGLAVTGGVYLLATVVFILLAPARETVSPSSDAPGQ